MIRFLGANASAGPEGESRAPAAAHCGMGVEEIRNGSTGARSDGGVF